MRAPPYVTVEGQSYLSDIPLTTFGEMAAQHVTARCTEARSDISFRIVLEQASEREALTMPRSFILARTLAFLSARSVPNLGHDHLERSNYLLLLPGSHGSDGAAQPMRTSLV
jgi:hypothetical protein